MAVPKVCGIETEYGIVHKGIENPNPINASSLLITAYTASLHRAAAGDTGVIQWDFEDEAPDRDARGDHPVEAFAPPVETHLVNTVLTNGARYYVDHAHPEYSSPECATAHQAVLYDRAGEEILKASMQAARGLLPPDQELVVYKNNSDGKGNSYGCHENYLMDRATPFANIVRVAQLHFVTRQIFTGSGKVGTEHPDLQSTAIPFQLTQRADFFEEPVGLETTFKRPVVNTRDEPHANPKKYRRLHVIAGDANMSEYATLIKLGTTAWVLALVDDNDFGPWLDLLDPVRAMQEVSFDLSLSESLQLTDGRTLTALEAQWELLQRCHRYRERRGSESVGGTSGDHILTEWETVLTQLESDPLQLADRLDWVAKYRLFNAYRERHGLDWNDHRLAAMDLQYHDIRPETSLSARLGLKRVVDPEDVQHAITEPPHETRAYFRGRALQQFRDQVVSANWDSVVFDTGDVSLRRVPMLEPLRGTKELTGQLFEGTSDAQELLELLDGNDSKS